MAVTIVYIGLAFFLAYAAKFPVAMAMVGQKGGYDNRYPREQQKALEGRGARALGAHLNSFEVFPGFALATLCAALSGYDINMVNGVALTFILSRVAYIACYLLDWSTIRSVVFGFGFLAIYAQFYFAYVGYAGGGY